MNEDVLGPLISAAAIGGTGDGLLVIPPGHMQEEVESLDAVMIDGSGLESVQGAGMQHDVHHLVMYAALDVSPHTGSGSGHAPSLSTSLDLIVTLKSNRLKHLRRAHFQPRGKETCLCAQLRTFQLLANDVALLIARSGCRLDRSRSEVDTGAERPLYGE